MQGITDKIEGPNQHTQAVNALLAQHGIAPTQQRRQIAQILFARPQHLSADQVLGRVNQNGIVASKATVYNTLGLFARKGLVREVIVDPNKVFYDSNISAHHHFYNIDTGLLQDIDSQELVLQGLPTLPAGVELDSIDIIVRVRTTK
ncbi:MAG: transcriptional repressor [Gammaproteobacteria bacterium]|nr:transcriptional repressor [Gammaproteobacteria bacterium]